MKNLTLSFEMISKIEISLRVRVLEIESMISKAPNKFFAEEYQKNLEHEKKYLAEFLDSVKNGSYVPA